MDDDFPDDETLKKQSYREFKLDSVKENNLKEIETNLKNRKINSDNKEEILEYLEDLYADISRVKDEEKEYEGEENFNVNRYLIRIKKLIKEIETI